MSRKIVTQFIKLLPLLILSLGLLWGRIYISESELFLFMIWNLFLAFVPWGISVGLKGQGKSDGIIFWFGVISWLLFFPNAPYVLTDFFHLKARNIIPLWYDLLFFGSFAWISMMFGFYSLQNIFDLWKNRWGQLSSWGMVVFVSFLSGFGIYLGRYLRINTWEVVSNPVSLIEEVWILVSDKDLSVQLWLFSFIYGALILGGYVSVSKS